MNSNLFARAEEFIWQNARLLERRLFDFHFNSGLREDVLSAILAYQNADGGFGNALEPDMRCPDSQPVPVQHSLGFMDEIGFDRATVQRACHYLQTITTSDGGVPWMLPSAHRYPRADWWNTEDNPPASLNPTAAIAGLLHKNNVVHDWLGPATSFCWRTIIDLQPDSIDEMGCVLTFLYNVLDRERAERELARLIGPMFAAGLVADVHAAGYVRKPLEWAPTPDHPLRKYFDESDIQANLDLVISEQQEDGGWNITWEAVSSSCELEWRGWVTLRTLRTLRANDRLH